jgi:hypothetical protein
VQGPPDWIPDWGPSLAGEMQSERAGPGSGGAKISAVSAEPGSHDKR